MSDKKSGEDAKPKSLIELRAELEKLEKDHAIAFLSESKIEIAKRVTAIKEEIKEASWRGRKRQKKASL